MNKVDGYHPAVSIIRIGVLLLAANGAFELRYLTGQTRRTLASRPIEVR